MKISEIKIKLFVLIRRVLNRAVGAFDSILGRKTELVVLCYHSFGPDNWFYNVTVDNFTEQINAISKTHSFITAGEFDDFVHGKINLKNPSVLLTIDDGYKDNLNVKEFLSRKNIKPILFTLADMTKVNRKELATEREMMSEKDLKELQKEGWTIGSHGYTHSNFNLLTAEEEIYEITESKKAIENIVKKPVGYIAYPKGNYNLSILQKVKNSGYRIGFSMDDGFITGSTDKYIIPRIGINNTHSISEFKNLYSPSAIVLRNIVKQILRRVYG